MMQSLFEKLQLHEEKNLLIQGLPSSIEKQFLKVSFAKNVTPLLRTRKIDFALIFSINQNQLISILREVMPALRDEAKLWIAYPKTASKIVSDLNRECSWACLREKGYDILTETTLDHVWSAIRFHRPTENDMVGFAGNVSDQSVQPETPVLPKRRPGFSKVSDRM